MKHFNHFHHDFFRVCFQSAPSLSHGSIAKAQNPKWRLFSCWRLKNDLYKNESEKRQVIFQTVQRSRLKRLWRLSVLVTGQCLCSEWEILEENTKWAPASYKWSYNPYKWPYKWLTVLTTLVIGVITQVISGRGPTLYPDPSLFACRNFGHPARSPATEAFSSNAGKGHFLGRHRLPWRIYGFI